MAPSLGDSMEKQRVEYDFPLIPVRISVTISNNSLPAGVATRLPSLRPEHITMYPRPPNLINPFHQLPEELIGQIFLRLIDDPVAYYNFAETERRQFKVAKQMHRVKLAPNWSRRIELEQRHVNRCCWAVDQNEPDYQSLVEEQPRMRLWYGDDWNIAVPGFEFHQEPKLFFYSSWMPSERC